MVQRAKDSVGAPGRPPRRISLWHIDYFELKLLERQPVQEGHPDLLSSHPPPRKQEINLPRESSHSYTRKWRDIFITREEIKGQKADVNKPCYFFTNLPPQALTRLRLLTNQTPKANTPSCQCLSNVLFD